MILRRVIEHVQSQNWFAVALDFVIVVFGVFIGIQVANWNDERLQAKQQRVYFERLHSDFTGIRTRIEEHFKVYNDSLEGGDYLLRIVTASEAELGAMVIDDAEITRAFNGLSSMRIPPPAPATYVEMVSEGQLSSIANVKLRDKLAEYDRLLGVVQEVSNVVSQHNVRHLPVLSRYIVTRAVSDPDALSGVHEEVLGYDIEGMRSDRDFRIAVYLLRSNALNSMEQRRFQMRLIEKIIALLEAELD